MSNYYLYHDEKKCIACHACEVQCKVNKGLAVGPRPNQVITVGPLRPASQLRAAFVFVACFHCEEPWCVPACPTGAMQRRPEDGVVFVDQDLCVGCKGCLLVCPWGAPQWDGEKGVAVKCDYCKDRLDVGLKPACVAACPTGALIFGKAERLPDIRRVRYAREIFASRT